MINHLIKESSSRVGNLVLLQAIDIPMGNDPPPLWAKLCLYHDEAYFISILTKINKTRAIKFKNASCFIDNEYNLKLFHDGGR